MASKFCKVFPLRKCFVAGNMFRWKWFSVNRKVDENNFRWNEKSTNRPHPRNESDANIVFRKQPEISSLSEIFRSSGGPRHRSRRFLYNFVGRVPSCVAAKDLRYGSSPAYRLIFFNALSHFGPSFAFAALCKVISALVFKLLVNTTSIEALIVSTI